MADKTTTSKSQQQEDELDHTFGSYETEMQEDEPVEKVGDKKAGKKGSANLIIMAVGALAILAVIYSFILPLFMGNKNNAAQQRPVQPPQNQAAANTPANNVSPAPASTAPTVTVPTPEVAPAAQPAASTNAQVNDFMNNSAVPAITINVPEASVSTSGNGVNINVPSVTPAATPVATPTVTSVTPQPEVTAPSATMTVTSNNSDLMENIRNYFDGKLETIQRQGQQQSERTQKLELSIDKIAARVSALEEGKRVAAPQRNIVKNAPVREVARKAPVERVVEPKRVAPSVDNERVIASKPAVRSTANSEELLIVKKSAASAQEAPRYKIHSLFNGRMWIENADNTHSSYSINDRLPNGEVIKSIDMEKDLVITDRGTIKAK